MIEVRNLTKWYGPTLAVDSISFDVPLGQVVGFLGPNGAGKTTTLRILTCFMPATSGSASVNGHNVFSDSLSVRQNIGYLPESTPLYGEMRVEEQLHFFGRLHGLPRAVRRKRIDFVSERCGLQKIRRRLIGQLSKGNRQRVGLALGLIHDPPILILDEPTAGMDPGQIAVIRDLITQLGREKTILLSTHILPEVEKTCQRVIIISSGKIVADGTIDELKSNVRSGARILIEIEADAVQVRQTIESLAVVDSVEVNQNDKWAIVSVTATDPVRDIREELGRAMTTRGWVLREMRYETNTLEDYFVQITSEQNEVVA